MRGEGGDEQVETGRKGERHTLGECANVEPWEFERCVWVQTQEVFLRREELQIKIQGPLAVGTREVLLGLRVYPACGVTDIVGLLLI